MGLEKLGDKGDELEAQDGPDKLTFTRKGDKKGIELFPSASTGESREKEEQERAQNLEQLDLQLQIEKLKDFAALAEKGDYQIKTNVSGENHIFLMEQFYQGSQSIEDNEKMFSALEQQQITLDQLSANFSCKEIEGRPEPLYLDFKIDVTELLSGSTDIAEKIRQTFAGTHAHYQEIYAAQQQQELDETAIQDRKETSEAIKASLHEQNYTVTETTYEQGPVIILARKPDQNKQLIISSMDGAIWTLSSSTGQSSQLGPGEVISSITSGEL